jgi:hypothetical protein
VGAPVQLATACRIACVHDLDCEHDAGIGMVRAFTPATARYKNGANSTPRRILDGPIYNALRVGAGGREGGGGGGLKGN